MKRTMLAIACVATLAAADAAAAESKAGGKSARTSGARFEFTTAEEVAFRDVEGMQGIQVAQLWGDLSKNGDWGALFKFKAGTDSGWHHHSSAIHLVMLSGTLAIEPEGGQPVQLRTNAYVDEPPKVKHRTTCSGGEDCVFFLHMTKKFDFIPAKEGAMAGGKSGGKAAGGMKPGDEAKGGAPAKTGTK